jgi:hypothetical protein
MDGILGHDVQNSCIFLGIISKSRQTDRCVVEQVLHLPYDETEVLVRAGRPLTMIVVPSLPAQGSGSAGRPGLLLTSCPST